MMLSGTTLLCCCCALLFWVCNVLEIIVGVRRTSNWTTDQEIYHALIPDYIMADWFVKNETKSLELASGFLKGLFWIFFCVPIIELAWTLSKGGTRAVVWNLGIILFVLGGSYTKWFSTIFWNGMYISFHQTAQYFNLEDWRECISPELSQSLFDGEDQIGWRVLEVNYIVARGLVWIVNSVEWVCLAAIFSFTFVSVFQWRQEDQSSFGAKWNSLGLFIGLLALVEFASEMVGFQGYKIAWIFVVLYAALNRLILIPLWIIILGFQLPTAMHKSFDTSFDSDGDAYDIDDGTTSPEVQLSQNPNQHRRPSQFTIDEDNESMVTIDQAAADPTSPPAEAFSTN
mmetsp:Transcript_34274/g.34830  ORF Transcript_34274/g.34830 Transcript_34274/m.34830 type:complete len:343 (-) Transcript_34274:440-1468(-)